MAKFVVDTNVLLSADPGDPPRHATHLSLACRERALAWLQGFLKQRDLLVVDAAWQILGEYQKKARSGDFAQLFLRQVLSASLVVFVGVEQDEDGHATLPEGLATVVHDLADRKFVAVALLDGDHPPIVNCADTDWVAWEDALGAHGLLCLHLCADELRARALAKASSL